MDKIIHGEGQTHTPASRVVIYLTTIFNCNKKNNNQKLKPKTKYTHTHCFKGCKRAEPSQAEYYIFRFGLFMIGLNLFCLSLACKLISKFGLDLFLHELN